MSLSYDFIELGDEDPTLREFHTLGATGTVRAEMHEGREHLVVPVIALMQGVIHAVNATQAEFVPIECLAQSPYGWNGRPVVLGHPTKDGIQISANDPKVLAAHQFGVIFQSHIAGQKLGLEAWIDPKRLETLGQHELLADIRAGKPIEVSVGAFVKTLAEEGIYNGKAYKARWASLLPDHLAFLPKSRGACSIEMGCGAHRLATAEERAEIYQLTDEGFVSLGGPGSGWHAEDGHVPGSQGGRGRDPDWKGDTVGRSIGREKSTTERVNELKRSIQSHKETRAEYTKKYGETHRHVRDQDKIIAGYRKDLREVKSEEKSTPIGDRLKEAFKRNDARKLNSQAAEIKRASFAGNHTKARELRKLYGLEEFTMGELETLGGPGSGWHAEDGHVPGSQGGKGTVGHMKAQSHHDKAAKAHEAAAAAIEKAAAVGISTTMPDDEYDAIHDGAHDASRAAEKLTREAAKVTKETGAKPYSVDAAKTYAAKASVKNWRYGATEEQAAAHREAARYHKAASKEHKVAASWGVKHLEEGSVKRSLKDRLVALLSFGKVPETEEALLEVLAGKKKDCEACKTSGSVSGNPCEACGGKGYTMKTYEGEEYPCEVHYSTLQTLMDEAKSFWDDASDLLDDLEAEDGDDEKIRNARLESFSLLCSQALGSLSSAAQLAWKIQAPSLDATSPRYAEELKALIGARNSASDLTKIQTVHDYAVALGANCGSPTAAEEHGGTTAEGDKMDKTVKDGIIKHLSECPCSGFTKDDVKFLESLPDQRLQTLEENAKAGEKVAADLKAAQEKAKEQELKIKTLETKTLTEAEVVAALPSHLKTLLEKAKVHTETRTAELLKALEEPTKGIFTADELKAKTLEDLEKLATLAGLTSTQNSNDYSAARPMPRMAGEVDLTIPPDPYAPGIKALQERDKTTH